MPVFDVDVITRKILFPEFYLKLVNILQDQSNY